eukprot:GILJ01011336.1.p1 GENE.GILJ01011336.1~~GILJ01011336.1.p1  ORF type:complete len:253 (-),score=31.86 GILJ01011336.1:180-938(-)
MASPLELSHYSTSLCFFTGALFFLLGSVLQIADFNRYFISSSITWMIGSVLFFIGGCTRLSADYFKREEQKKHVDTVLKLSFTASSFQFIGGILFVVGSGMFIVSPEPVPLVVAAEIIWIVGALLYFIGLGVKLACDQVELYELDRNCSKRTLIATGLGVSATNVFFAGSVAFLFGAIAYMCNETKFILFGNISWTVGCLFFMVGSCFKILSDILKYRSNAADLMLSWLNHKSDSAHVRSTANHDTTDILRI